MKRVTVAMFAAVTVAGTFASTTSAADPLPDRVVVMYFHRTQRCPTCLKMGSYAEEAVKKGFANQSQEGSVVFHFVDFQDKKNSALSKGYKISGPALVVAKIEQNKVKKHKDLKDIWTTVREKPEFLKYVRENVAAHIK